MGHVMKTIVVVVVVVDIAVVVAESVLASDPHHGHHHDPHHPGLLVMPTSPLSVTTASMSASDDMIENENEMLRDR